MAPGTLTRILTAAAIGTALPALPLAYLNGLDAGVSGVPVRILHKLPRWTSRIWRRGR